MEDWPGSSEAYDIGNAESVTDCVAQLLLSAQVVTRDVLMSVRPAVLMWRQRARRGVGVMLRMNEWWCLAMRNRNRNDGVQPVQ